MGVECSAVSGFGLLLTTEEVEAALKKIGIEWDHDEPHIELCHHYKLPEPERIGSLYSGNFKYLFYAEQSYDSETGSTTTDPKQFASLKGMSEECGLDQAPGFHEGELWH